MKVKNGILGIAGLLVFGVSAWAASSEEPKVEITSFIAAGARTRAAELCGKVTGLTDDWVVVRVLVDPKTDKPGVYNALVGKDGKFCTTVVSYSGQAVVSIGWGPGKEVVSDVVNLVSKVSR